MQATIQRLLIIIFYCWCSMAFTQETPNGFQIPQAKKSLLELKNITTQNNATLARLNEVIEQLSAMQKQASQCVALAEKEYQGIESQLKKIKPSVAENSPERRYLEAKLNNAQQVLSECYLVYLQANDQLVAASERVEKEFTFYLFAHEKPIWKVIPLGLKELLNLPQMLEAEKISADLHLALFNHLTLALLAAFILLSLAIGGVTRYLLKKRTSQEADKPLLTQILQASRRFVYRNAYLITTITGVTLFLYLLSAIHQQELRLAHLGLLLILYTFYSLIVRIAFYPVQPAKPLFAIPAKLGKKVYLLLQGIAITLLVALVSKRLLQSQDIAQTIVDLSKAFTVTVLTVFMFMLVLAIANIPYLKIRYRSLTVLVGISLSLLLVFILIAELTGLQYLAHHLLTALLVTFVVLLLAWLLYQVVKSLLYIFEPGDYPPQQRIRKIFGLRKLDRFPEVYPLRLALEILLWGGVILILFDVWGLPETDYRTLLNALFNGVTVGGITIYPIKILSSLVMFSILVLLARLLRAHYVRTHRATLSSGSLDAVGTMIFYLGFSIALLLALLISGVNFTGLAIIAGALSVGIGFGLQGIANNFVSGIVLLLERPVKVGDRVIVNGMEGFIKKISIRATRITTLDKSDVIVPNADLITGQVTNLMFKDSNWRVAVKVGVEYGSDTALVEKLLLEVADAHPDVIHDDESCKPVVLFKAFADSCLEFTLYCVIRDVNKKYTVPSDLHFAIDQAFRQHHIVIAFPQRDLHVRSWPASPINMNKGEA
jgi:potassium efflux system protein